MTLSQVIINIFQSEDKKPTKYDGEVIWCMLANNNIFDANGNEFGGSFRYNGGQIAQALGALTNESYDYIDFYCSEALAEDCYMMIDLFNNHNYVIEVLEKYNWLNRWPTEEELKLQNEQFEVFLERLKEMAEKRSANEY